MKKKKYFDDFLNDEDAIKDLLVKLKDRTYTGDFDPYARTKFLFEIHCPIRGWQGLMPEAGFLLVSGKEKSMKSTLANMLASAFLTRDFCTNYSNYQFIGSNQTNHSRVFQKIVCNYGSDKMFLGFDTEMDINSFKKSQARLIKNAGYDSPPLNYRAFSLSSLGDPVEKLASILINIELYKTDIGLIVIDVIPDLLEDDLSGEQSKQLIGIINAKCQMYGISLIGTIHQNRNNNHTMGNIGLICNKKANYVIDTTREDVEDPNTPSMASTSYKRDGEFFKPFLFGYVPNADGFLMPSFI